jgi:hypothetical protein
VKEKLKASRSLLDPKGRDGDGTQAATVLAQVVKGRRDRALLALLWVALTVAHLQQRDGRWVIVDLRGKHGRLRTIAVPAWVKLAVDLWCAAPELPGAGSCARSTATGKITGESLSPPGGPRRSGLLWGPAGPPATVARSEKNLRQALPQRRRRSRADPIIAGACFHFRPPNATSAPART